MDFEFYCSCGELLTIDGNPHKSAVVCPECGTSVAETAEYYDAINGVDTYDD